MTETEYVFRKEYARRSGQPQISLLPYSVNQVVLFGIRLLYRNGIPQTYLVETIIEIGFNEKKVFGTSRQKHSRIVETACQHEQHISHFNNKPELS